MAEKSDVILDQNSVRVRGSGSSPVLDIEGGNNWDLSAGDGDVRVGDDQNMLKMGVARGGAGAGNARLWATRNLYLGSRGESVVTVDSDGIHPDGNYNLGTSQNPWADVNAESAEFDGNVKIKGGLTMLGEEGDGIAFINRVITSEFSVGQGGVISSLLPDANDLNLGSSSSPWNAVHAKSVNKQSDARLKSDVTDLDGGLDAVLDLRPVTYRWRDDGADTHLGLLAQEVKKVLPEAVDDPGEADGYLGVDYTELVAVLVDAVQDQHAENEDLSAEVETQREEIERQDERIAALEERLAALEDSG